MKINKTNLNLAESLDKILKINLKDNPSFSFKISESEDWYCCKGIFNNNNITKTLIKSEIMKSKYSKKDFNKSLTYLLLNTIIDRDFFEKL